MSSNPFDLERAIDQLRSETPSREATLRAKQNLIKPRPRSTMRPRAIVFGAVAVAALALLWPRGVAGAAWAQIKQKTGVQTRVHITNKMVIGLRDHKPQMYSETWIDGRRYSATMYLPFQRENLKLSLWIRNDGKRDLFYNPLPSRNGVPAWANVTKVKPHEGPYWFGYAFLDSDSSIIDDVIKQAGWEVLEHKSGVEVDGKTYEQYRLTRSFGGKYKRTVIAYADPETKLVRRIDSLGQRGEVTQICEMDYPAEIPDSAFKIEAPAHVEVRDLDQERANLTAALKKGLDKKGKINLRAVLHDRSGGLWVLWTGGAPAGSFKYPVKVEGFSKPAYGLKEFTLGWRQAPHKTKPAPGVGERLGGMAIPIWKKLDKVTVTVPVLDSKGNKTGAVTFANVPVRRIGSIYDFAEELGIR